MLEILLLSACLHNVACSESSAAYYEYRADLRAGVQEFEQRLKRRVNERALEVLIPLALVGAGADGALNLGNGLALSFKPKANALGLQYNLAF